MDNFAEQLVKKELTDSDKTKKLAILIGGSLLTIVFALGSFLMLGSMIIALAGFILAVGSGCGTYFMLRNSDVEYEYSFTNGDLDIDKIIAQTKRKPMISIQVSKFTDFGRYDDDAPEETDDMTVVFATDNIASKEYYADFPHEEYGNTRLIFCPDKRMLANICPFMQPALRRKHSALLESVTKELKAEEDEFFGN